MKTRKFVGLLLLLLVCSASKAQVISEDTLRHSISNRLRDIGRQLYRAAGIGLAMGYGTPELREIVTPEAAYKMGTVVRIEMIPLLPDSSAWKDTVTLLQLNADSVKGDIAIVFRANLENSDLVALTPIAFAAVVTDMENPKRSIPFLWVKMAGVKEIISPEDYDFLREYAQLKLLCQGQIAQQFADYSENGELWMNSGSYKAEANVHIAKILGDLIIDNLKRELMDEISGKDMQQGKMGNLIDSAGKEYVFDESRGYFYGFRPVDSALQNPMNPDDPTDLIDTMIWLERDKIDRLEMARFGAEIKGIIYLRRFNIYGKLEAMDTYYISLERMMNYTNLQFYGIFDNCVKYCFRGN